MQVEIYVTDGPVKGRHFAFNKTGSLLCGRALDAHISLSEDHYVSRQHFLLEIFPSACKLKELGSRNGVFVNGVRYGGKNPPKEGMKLAPNGVKEVELRNGDKIVVGKTHIEVVIKTGKDLREGTRSETADSEGRIIRCHRCGKDVTEEASLFGQPEGVEYVCKACQEKFSYEEKTPIEDRGRTPSESPSQMRALSAHEASLSSLNISGYRVEEVIKRGGIGKLYRAKELKTGRSVAIKTLRPQMGVDQYVVAIFNRELSIIRQLKHRHIVRFFGYGRTADLFYFIFEFVDGMDLAKFIRSEGGSVPLDEALPIFIGALEGLTYAHRTKITSPTVKGEIQIFQGVVHRNLKPQNILLAREKDLWVPKIADFELSKSFESVGMTNITRQGDVFGTPLYWPREQITHYKFLCPATDVFSIAAVFYEMLTGSWVREGFKELSKKYRQLGRVPSISEYMNTIAANPPMPIRERNPDIPQPLAEVIDRALRETEIAPDVHEIQPILGGLRYPDAGVFRDALLQAFKAIGVSDVLKTVRALYQAGRKESTSMHEPSSEGVVFSAMETKIKRQVALFVLDLAQSTQYILNMGDTDYSLLIGGILRRVKRHSSSPELVFLKCMGDGFLAVFHSLSAAFSLALSFLDEPVHSDVHLRIALHWGKVMPGPDGDVLGKEVHRVCRIESIQAKDHIGSESHETPIPDVDRVLITREGLEQLSVSDQKKFRAIGKFQLKGFDKLNDVWMYT